jgi:hypothetical protein
MCHAEDGFEVFTAMTMKNAVFWDIKTLFVLHGRLCGLVVRVLGC